MLAEVVCFCFVCSYRFIWLVGDLSSSDLLFVNLHYNVCTGVQFLRRSYLVLA